MKKQPPLHEIRLMDLERTETDPRMTDLERAELCNTLNNVGNHNDRDTLVKVYDILQIGMKHLHFTHDDIRAVRDVAVSHMREMLASKTSL